MFVTNMLLLFLSNSDTGSITTDCSGSCEGGMEIARPWGLPVLSLVEDVDEQRLLLLLSESSMRHSHKPSA